MDVEFVKMLFNYGVPAGILIAASLGVYHLLKSAGFFLGPIVKDVAVKHVEMMATLEVVGKGLLQQAEAQTEISKRHDETLDKHTLTLDEIHKAVVK